MIAGDPLRRILYVDLGRKRFWVEERPELFDENLGGTGAAIGLLAQECPQGADPLGPDNPVVLAVGPLTGLFPLASKTVAMFKSPLTGNLGESHCGGRSAVAIRLAGYGAIVLKGRSEIPVYVSVAGNEVAFRDASTLWGMGSTFTAGRVIREAESGAGLRSIMRIGRAGERLVRYASVTTETYRHFGRLGLGAVFGAKNLKALVVSGKRSLPVTDPKVYRETYDEIYEASVGSAAMKKYHDLGTAENILPLNAMKGLPTRNLTAASFEGADSVSGEALAEGYLGRRLACSHCPVGCIHIAALREPHEKEPYFYTTRMICYDYEPIYSLGTMLGIASPRDFLLLMDAAESLGLDVMSAGVVLAWATEAFTRGLIGEGETLGVRLQWGDAAGFRQALAQIVAQPNEFYRHLAMGVDSAARKYGGEEYALAFGGNEMPGYHTGPAGHLGYLAGLRHSHLDNAGYSIDQKVLMKREAGPEELAELILTEERWRQVLSGLVVCFFARGVYKPEVVRKALALAGCGLAEAELDTLGRRIYGQKYAFKRREGFDLEAQRIPGRILETPSPSMPITEALLRETLKALRQRIETEGT
jgi:aldehyde:ferredoxin oxidoreductase